MYQPCRQPVQKCDRSSTLASRNESPGSGRGLQRAASLGQALYLGSLPPGAPLGAWARAGLACASTTAGRADAGMPASSGRSQEPRGGVAWVVLHRSELVPGATAARADSPACTTAKLALSSLGTEAAQATAWASIRASEGTMPGLHRAGKLLQRPASVLCHSCRARRGWSAACHVYCPGGTFTLFKKKERRRERESCSIVLLQAEKGWTNSNQTQNRNSSQAETFFCQVSALVEFLTAEQ